MQPFYNFDHGQSAAFRLQRRDHTFDTGSWIYLAARTSHAGRNFGRGCAYGGCIFGSCTYDGYQYNCA